MPLRQKSPDFNELLARELAEAPDSLFRWTHDGLDDSRYFHWSQLIRHTPPDGLTHEQWWLVLKIKRSSSARTVPLTNKKGTNFKFSMTDEILKSVEEIAARLGGPRELASGTLNSTSRDRYVVRSLVEEAITSSQLEGASTSRKEAVKMLDSGRSPSDRSELMILNNYRGMEFVKQNASSPLSPELVLHLHEILTEGTLDNPADAGRLEPPDQQRVSVWAYDQQVHVPPPAEELLDRLKVLCAFANQDTSATPYIPPIVRAIIVHFMFGYDHYFTDGNGRTARTAFYWLMLQRSYWLSEFLTISKILKSIPGQYGDAYEFSEDDDDLTYFINFQLGVITRALDELDAYISKRQDQTKRIHTVLRSAATAFNARQSQLIEWIDRDSIPTLTAQLVSNRYQVTPQTARNDLKHLEEYGLLSRSDSKKPIAWVPAPNLRDKIASLEDEVS
ncbi:MAG: Fic family protein [Ancrocorticia populi]|uniref:Fic family protein n=1 Tax=Ancrocorticia populi TaxID=2175228 RepID=UPI003F900C06